MLGIFTVWLREAVWGLGGVEGGVGMRQSSWYLSGPGKAGFAPGEVSWPGSCMRVLHEGLWYQSGDSPNFSLRRCSGFTYLLIFIKQLVFQLLPLIHCRLFST